jgi:cell wall-associated NlpC family hydrolase
MKKTTILNFTFISSLLLFSACSTKETKPKPNIKQLSVYNIMGISAPKKEIVHFIVKKYNRVKRQISTTPSTLISPDIEVISYNKNIPSTPLPTTQIAPYSVNDIERNAKSFLGTPYVWGATGPTKFDCSGFTQWVFRDAGINIPRVSREQAKVGTYVRYEDLQRGDMVFFDTKKHRTGKVCHVGIYLGNGDFIHASSSGKKVVIFNFNDKKFYKKRFLWGRRVINDTLHYASN